VPSEQHSLSEVGCSEQLHLHEQEAEPEALLLLHDGYVLLDEELLLFHEGYDELLEKLVELLKLVMCIKFVMLIPEGINGLNGSRKPFPRFLFFVFVQTVFTGVSAQKHFGAILLACRYVATIQK